MHKLVCVCVCACALQCSTNSKKLGKEGAGIPVYECSEEQGRKVLGVHFCVQTPGGPGKKSVDRCMPVCGYREARKEVAGGCEHAKGERGCWCMQRKDGR